MATNINLTHIETDLSTFHTGAATGKTAILSSGAGILNQSLVWKRGTATVIGAKQKSTSDGGSSYSYYHNEFGSVHVYKGDGNGSIATPSVFELLLEDNDDVIIQMSAPDGYDCELRMGQGADLDAYTVKANGSQEQLEFKAQSASVCYINSAKLQMIGGRDIAVGNTVRAIADTPVTGYIELLSSSGDRFFVFGVTTRPASL